MPIQIRFICIVIVVALLAGCMQTVPSSTAAVQSSRVAPASTEPSPTATQSVSSKSTEAPKPSPQPHMDTVRVTLPEDVSVVVNGLTAKVDPMIEMLSIVQYLSDYDKQYHRLTKIKTSYHDDIDLAFGSYKEHDAVKFFNEAVTNGFVFDSPPHACLYLDKDFIISEIYANSDYAKNRMRVDMNRFRDVMEQFCIDTNFIEFFEEHQDFYSQMLEQYKGGFPKWDIIKTMEDYYGQVMASYNIVLVPLFHSGGYGAAVSRADGVHTYYIGGPVSNGPNKDIPAFGDEDTVVYLVAHELGHSFIPINELDNTVMANEVKRSEYLMAPIREKMTANSYGVWYAAYEELVLRAAVIDIAVRNTGAPLGQKLLNERKAGFIYIDDVYEVLQQYSENRDKYPTFDLFIPVITDYLMEKLPKEQRL